MPKGSTTGLELADAEMTTVRPAKAVEFCLDVFGCLVFPPDSKNLFPVVVLHKGALDKT